MSDPEHDRQAQLFATVLGTGLVLLPLAYPPWGGSFLPLKRTGLFLLLAALGLAVAKSRDTDWMTAPVVPAAIAYPGIALLSSLWAINPFTAAIESAQLIALMAVFVLCLQNIGPTGIFKAARFASAGGAIVATLGIAEYFGLDRSILAATGSENLRIPSAGRPSATLSFRNVAASYLIGCLPLVWISWSIERRPLYRRLFLCAGFLMSVFLVYTRTRGAWLGLVAGISVSSVYLYRNGVRPREVIRSIGWRGILIGVVFFALATLNPVTDTRSPQKFDVTKATPAAALASVVSPSADRGRLIFWQNTVDMALSHPILGVGYDNWEYYYPVYDRGQWNQAYAEPVRPHNDVLWVWSELGPVGLLAFLGFLAIPVVAAFRQRDSDRETTILNAGCVAAICALFVHGCFSFLREQPIASLYLWFAVAGLSATQKRRRKGGVRWLAPAAIVLGLLGTWVGVSHMRFDAGYYVAKTQYDAGDFEGAFRRIHEATEAGRFDHRAAFLKGRILQAQGRKQEAVSAYRVALTQHPNYANTHHNLGGLLAAVGDIQGARHHFHRALEIRPGYHEVRINLANALIRAGDIPGARHQVEQVIAQNDRIPEAYGLLGAILLHQGDADASVSVLEEAIRLNPDLVEAYNNLAVAYEQTGRREEALDALRSLARLWQGDPGYKDSILAEIRRLEEDTP